jgi:hypothetical protein
LVRGEAMPYLPRTEFTCPVGSFAFLRGSGAGPFGATHHLAYDKRRQKILALQPYYSRFIRKLFA